MKTHSDRDRSELHPEAPVPKGFRVVDLQRYCELLISRRHFERFLRVPSGYRGLRDRANGETFLVREEVLVHAC